MPESLFAPFFYFMEWYKIITLDNLVTQYEGVTYYERWQVIVGFPDYEVSDFGRVKSLRRNKILKQRKFKKGYPAIDLRLDEKKYTFYVHKLVGKHFVPNPYNKPQINHKKRIRSHNFFLELEWVTNQENVQHGWDNGRIGWKQQRLLASK